MTRITEGLAQEALLLQFGRAVICHTADHLPCGKPSHCLNSPKTSSELTLIALSHITFVAERDGLKRAYRPAIPNITQSAFRVSSIAAFSGIWEETGFATRWRLPFGKLTGRNEIYRWENRLHPCTTRKVAD